MDEKKLFKWFIVLGLPSIFFLILFLALLVNESGSGDPAIIASTSLSSPFESSYKYTVTSSYGYRIDPFGSGETKFHSGIDLGAECGTSVLASANGIIEKVDHSTDGLGNSVFIRHETDKGIMYTVYGHMLDNSIVVEEKQPIVMGQLIGQVGNTGDSTGCHLHFMIMKNKISFKSEDLIDPYFVIYGLY